MRSPFLLILTTLKQRIYEAEEERILLPFTGGIEAIEISAEED